MSKWLSIVGIGEDGLAGLGAVARALIDDATVLIGGARHLAMLPDDGRERLTWSSPLSKLVEEILNRRGQATVSIGTVSIGARSWPDWHRGRQGCLLLG